MTLTDIEQIPKNMLTAADVAPYLECDPQTIRWQAKRDAEFGTRGLQFPVMLHGASVRIPKEGFLNWARYEGGLKV